MTVSVCNTLCQILILEGHYPACFSCFTFPTHLIEWLNYRYHFKFCRTLLSPIHANLMVYKFWLSFNQLVFCFVRTFVRVPLLILGFVSVVCVCMFVTVHKCCHVFRYCQDLLLTPHQYLHYVFTVKLLFVLWLSNLLSCFLYFLSFFFFQFLISSPLSVSCCW